MVMMARRLGITRPRPAVSGLSRSSIDATTTGCSLYARVPREARGACARFGLEEASDTSHRVTRALPSLRRRRLHCPH